ncbi:HNH endonuclease [Nocardioides sp. dk4132]|uniref:HNH endonuclease signature motif containing protein n=1 Tax=unclassified Nocardioides TaxID=2615069 RepID=UPI001294D446|nr:MULTISPECIES: HNH endonuclease signature motif containing protein [unclassified Nocardioides]MQW74900.1 HNH endonuclease [Nocardioides sp. dk4132]QGA07909.1 HNH endonuclease [Nocardioides sp. dk884]
MASPELPDSGSPAAVLAFVQEQRAAAQRAEALVLEGALLWAAMHPEESVSTGSSGGWLFAEVAVPLGGEGTPLVAEFAPLELGAALGMSTDAARGLMGASLELAHRLPRTWKQLKAGAVPVWKARRLAELTTKLPPEGADFVDRQLAGTVGKVGWAMTERLVDQARVLFDPEAAEKQRREAADRRRFDVHTREATHDGTVRVEGELDLADAMDLDTAIGHGAEELAALGCAESLDVRRSLAAGELARRQLALDLRAEAGSAGEGVASAVKPRRVVIHVHLSDAAISRDEAGVAQVEETRSIVSTEQVRDWCANPQTQVVIKPVIDLDAHHHTEAYAIPDRMVEQTRLTQPTCAFPWCERRATRCDCDHVVAHAAGGPTCSCNLAPLCRRHHRAKTHTGWRYDKIDAATYLWRSPHGLHLIKDRGTTALLSAHPPGAP